MYNKGKVIRPPVTLNLWLYKITLTTGDILHDQTIFIVSSADVNLGQVLYFSFPSKSSNYWNNLNVKLASYIAAVMSITFACTNHTNCEQFGSI